MDNFDRRNFLKLAGAAGVASLAGASPFAFAADKEAVFYANITAVEPIMKAMEAATGVQG